MIRILLLSTCLVVAACGADKNQPEESVGREIADDYNAALDNAANVELQVQQAKDDVDAALKRAEGNDNE